MPVTLSFGRSFVAGVCSAAAATDPGSSADPAAAVSTPSTSRRCIFITSSGAGVDDTTVSHGCNVDWRTLSGAVGDQPDGELRGPRSRFAEYVCPDPKRC